MLGRSLDALQSGTVSEVYSSGALGASQADSASLPDARRGESAAASPAWAEVAACLVALYSLGDKPEESARWSKVQAELALEQPYARSFPRRNVYCF